MQTILSENKTLLNIVIPINDKNYLVKSNEFVKTIDYEYNHLSILQHLGKYERLVSLLEQLSLLYKLNAVFTGISHGGYIVIETLDFFDKVYCFFSDHINQENFKYNLKQTNKVFYSLEKMDTEDYLFFIDEETEYTEYLIDIINSSVPILVTKQSPLFYNQCNLSNYFIYELSDTPFIVCIPIKYQDSFNQSILSKYVSGHKMYYDNLIQLVMIVKNGGILFQEMLEKNISQFDYWTIVDTGSTDNTIDIIKNVLKNKPGQLYQEPFTDFKETRNRSLELAGTRCKFNLVLDDTYVIQGNLRKFLHTVRGDQFSESFDLYITSDDNQYISNRITKSQKKLRYIYRIHEVISTNKNVCIPFSTSSILDMRSDDMEKRTLSRKQFDLDLLFKDLEEFPDQPRMLYYIAQTYSCIKNYEKAYEYFIKRVNHPLEGLLQEKIDACFEAGRIANFKLNKSWEECKELYEKSFSMDHRRPDSLYFLGIHYYLEKDE